MVAVAECLSCAVSPYVPKQNWTMPCNDHMLSLLTGNFQDFKWRLFSVAHNFDTAVQLLMETG